MMDFASAASSLAYLDPSSGSFALQILLASLFGAGFALKQSWAGVRGWIDANLRAGRGRDQSGDSRPGIHGQPNAESY